MKHFLRLAVAGVILSSAQPSLASSGPLPSWQDGAARQSIVEFVERVTTESGPDYVAPGERIAVFDNDGTLWPEQPMYVQLAFALDRVKALADLHPEWKEKQPFKAVLENDMAALAGIGEKGLLELVVESHTGMSTEVFAKLADEWIKSAKHPKTGKAYTEMVYQPMLELQAYLRDNGFKTFIVSGGGVEFIRPWAEQVYGIPPEQVIGSSVKTKFEMRGGRPILFRLPEIDFVDDKAGKPVGIHSYIGHRPIAAFGNSDGDLEMLQWTTMGGGPRLGVIVHHTDEDREYAYDRNSPFGKLDKALDAAKVNNWTVVDMKNDWKCVYRDQCNQSAF